MYNIKKSFHGINVGKHQLIKSLISLIGNYKIVCCGDDDVFIHVDDDNKIINIDNTDMATEYPDDEELSFNEFEPYSIDKSRYDELINIMIDDMSINESPAYTKDKLINMGFSKLELKHFGFDMEE